MEKTERSIDAPLRRLLPRQPHSRLGKYRVEGDAEQRWRPCRLTDLTVAGAGVELMVTTPAVGVGKHLTVLLDDEADARLLKGQIRQVTEKPDGSVKVGVQFVELRDAEQSHLQSLRDLGLRW